MDLRTKKGLLYLLVLGILLPFFLNSCIYDKEGNETEETTVTNSKLYIHLSSVTPYGDTPISSRVKEKIKSLRIIILNDDRIEVNELVEFANEEDAQTFVYDIEKEYVEGNKKFFFIANEESVGALQFPASFSLPPGVSTSSLKELLNNDLFNSSEDNSNGVTLESILKSVSFLPVYEVTPNEGEEMDLVSPAGTVYLPYSTCYSEEDITDKTIYKDRDGNTVALEATMYLVPVATKFEFKFINGRSNNVRLSDLKVTQFDNLNYLIANVGSADVKKTLPNSSNPIYWPDWLAYVAVESWKNMETSDDNSVFNAKYGWITDYFLPGGSSKTPVTFPLNTTSTNLTIPAATKNADNELIPTELDLGPYYLPESINLVNGAHQYGINFTVRDMLTDVSFKFENDANGSPVLIENLGALFRDTHVVITVRLGEGPSVVEGIYAELMPWIKKEAMGYVGDYRN